MTTDVAVVGSGPAGLAAATAAAEREVSVLIIEREIELGGILQQCIHNGFGVEIFAQDLTGPEYAQRYIERARQAGVQALLDSMVLDVLPDRRIYVTNPRDGIVEVHPKAIVLAMGCRERTRGALAIPGTRPAGVYTAGTAQRLVNIEGYMPGRRFVILGSGDIGMIMARRLTFEGAVVERVLENMPYLNGLSRNYVQCIRDYNIPLEFCRTVAEVRGRKRVEAVVSVAVDEQRRPIPGTEEVIPCDTLLLSVGLIPENELSRRMGIHMDPATGGPIVDERMGTSLRGVFAAGNVVHVYDLVDWVTRAGEVAGRSAAEHVLGLDRASGKRIRTVAGKNVRLVVPQVFGLDALLEQGVQLQLRVRQPIEEKTRLTVTAETKELFRKTLRYVRPGEMIQIEMEPRVGRWLENTDSVVVDIAKAD
ncbi:MAG: FAD-dependent oxidoreductase [Chloroflexi bacterium]|nr:FAD-dependent oxidoreductase [Chloroflexota bacterium]